MEEKIIEARFIKNKWANIMAIIGIGLIGLFAIVFVYSYSNDLVSSYNGGFAPICEELTLPEYFVEALFTPFYYEIYCGFICWLGILFIILWFVMTLMMNHCEMLITNTRVIGKTSFGKQVDLPMNQISAVGLGGFSSITVATSAGRVHFWLVENRDEVHKALNGLLVKLQSESKSNTTTVSTPPTSTADELKKYKELLDAGVITQEEFDAKKKQLLGL